MSDGRLSERLKRVYPFNAEQTVNILSEFGPLVTMFIVNAAAGIDAGTWALLITTVIAMVVMRKVLGRLPIFPQIASTVTIGFGVLTLVTGDPMWVQIKVTIFNALFAGVLFGGLWASASTVKRASWQSVVAIAAIGILGEIAYLAYIGHLASLADMIMAGQVSTMMICVGGVVVGFVTGALVIKRNFFEYVFEKTFHYTREGWDRFTLSFAWFFMFTAVANELVRLGFPADETFSVLGHEIDGVNVWILFKILLIMPLSGLYAWWLTRVMQKHRLPDPVHGDAGLGHVDREPRKDAAQFSAVVGALKPQPIAVRSSTGDLR